MPATPKLIDVKIEPWSDSCGNTGISVHPVWADVDRPDTGGWVVSSRSVADRLARALRAGAIYTSIEVDTDKNGQTYVAARGAKVLGRKMNADLRRLGY